MSSLVAEADRLCNAQRYECSKAHRDTRAGHYQRNPAELKQDPLVWRRHIEESRGRTLGPLNSAADLDGRIGR